MSKVKIRNAYIISQMYKGEYIEDKMGGEIINLFNTDNGENYIFVTPYGYIAEQYNDKIKAVILTRSIKTNVLEVLGVAKVEKQIARIVEADLKRKKKYNDRLIKIKIDQCGKQFEKYISKHPIEYGKVSLKDIYASHLTGILTFKSKELLLPKEGKKIYIVAKDYKYDFNKSDIKINLIDKVKNITIHNKPTYVDDITEKKSYRNLERLIQCKRLWNIQNCKFNEKITDKNNKNRNFLQIIKKETDEISYSNMFSYFFSNYPKLLGKFMKEILHIKHFDINRYDIKREYQNIDLFIEDENNIVIIENKLRSGINGFNKTQLDKYYKVASKINYEYNPKKKISCYLFLPVYNKTNLKNIPGIGKYNQISYAELEKFFKKQNINDKYYNDFCNALYRHTLDVEKDYYSEMLQRFVKEIKKHRKQ